MAEYKEHSWSYVLSGWDVGKRETGKKMESSGEKKEFFIQEDGLQRLIELLKFYEENEKANDVFEMAAYIDGVGRKLDELGKEINSVNIRISRIDLARAGRVEAVGGRCERMCQYLRTAKEGMAERAGEFVELVKEEGRKGFQELPETASIKENLRLLQETAGASREEIERALAPMEGTGRELQELFQNVFDWTGEVLGRLESLY